MAVRKALIDCKKTSYSYKLRHIGAYRPGIGSKFGRFLLTW